MPGRANDLIVFPDSFWQRPEVTEAMRGRDMGRFFALIQQHKAYIALRAAEETAHEEVAGRPSVHRVIRDLMTSAPPSMRREIEQFAAQIGVSR